MKNNFFALLLLSLLSSCGIEQVEYLYDKEDPEYPYVLELGVKKCVKDSSVFNSLNKTSDFSVYKSIVGKLYEIEEVNSKSIKYAKILSIDNETMRIAIRSKLNATPSVLVYTQDDNRRLLSAISYGICTKNYEHSSLSQGTTLSFVSKRENKLSNSNNTVFGKLSISETFKLDTKLPLILKILNSDKNIEEDGNGKKSSKTEKYNISELSDSTCLNCEIQISSSVTTCYPQIDPEHYQKKNVENLLVNSTANCKTGI